MIKKHISIFSLLLVVLCSKALAVPSDIANIPLYLPQPVGVNFLTTIDDSGSMDWEWLPDNLASPNLLRGSANSYNPLAYRPLTATDSYVLPPWPNATGTNWGTMNLPPFNAAFNDGFANQTSTNTNGTMAGAGGGGNTYAPNSTSNLGTSYQFAARTSNERAFYAIYDPAQTAAVCPAPSTNLDQCYVKVTLNDDGTKTYTRRQNTGCVNNSNLACYTVAVGAPPGVVAGVNENQNFAIWYSYYRKRILMAKSAALRSLSTLPTNTRLGCHVLNAGGSAATTCSKNIDVLREFTGANQLTLFEKIAKISTGNSTPTKDAFRRVGAYFSSNGVNSPWALVPGTTDAPQLACRKSFHMMLTDGYYNSNAAVPAPMSSADSTAATLPNGQSYSGAQLPYASGANQTLADIAFYYWKTNLNPTVASNKVIPSITYPDPKDLNAEFWNPRNDPATWPHLVNYPVALGLSGTIAKNDANLNALTSGAITWPTPVDNDATAIDDLWHAAINSRGDFYSAARPNDLVTAFSDIVGKISAASGSGSGISVSGAVASSDGYAYQSIYNSATWTGEIVAYPVLADGSYGPQIWRTSDAGKVPTYTNRVIKTIAGSSIVDFNYGNLTAAQKSVFLGPDVSPGLPIITDLVGAANAANAGNLLGNYLRGDQSQERTASGGLFRKRDFRVGDILGSGVLYVSKRNSGYASLPGQEGATYDAYVKSKASKTKILVTGANDGMVHFFNASTGVEYFNFVPPTVMGKLYQLARPTYTHQFYVDGQLSEWDYYAGGSWRTVVTGTTGFGGTGVFAIDITDRDNPLVLWNIDASNNPNIGYGIKKVSVARAADGNWYAVFGNGYESTNGQAALFSVKISGSAFDPSPVINSVNVGAAGNNGLSVPVIVRGTKYAYAGDLLGNLWRFELNGSTLGVSYSSTKPLFKATGPTGQVQPITAQPDVFEPKQGGLMVTFGTGRLYKKSDTSDVSVQSFYGVWDKDVVAASLPMTRSNLMQQSIVSQTYNSATARSERTLTSNSFTQLTQRGWFIDLTVGGQAATGERVITTPLTIFGRSIFATYTPSATSISCEADSTSFVMSVDAFSGAIGTLPIFDTNGDGVVDVKDSVVAVSVNGTVGDPTAQIVSSNTPKDNVGPVCEAGVPCGDIAGGAGGGTITFRPFPPGTDSGGTGSSAFSCGPGWGKTTRDGKEGCGKSDSGGCDNGLISVKTSQISGGSVSAQCIQPRFDRPRMGWREIQ